MTTDFGLVVAGVELAKLEAEEMFF